MSNGSDIPLIEMENTPLSGNSLASPSQHPARAGLRQAKAESTLHSAPQSIVRAVHMKCAGLK